MKILKLTPELPERAGTGGGRRAWELVTGLVDHGHEVAIGSVARADQGSAVRALTDRGIRVAIPVRPEPQWREALQGAARSPRTVGVLAGHAFHRWQASVFAAQLVAPLQELLASWTPDVVLIEHDWAMNELARLVPAGLPMIAEFQNVSYRIHAAAAQHAAGARRRAYERREARLQERELSRLPGAVIAASACSAEEASEITARLGVPCAVVHNGADTQALGELPLAGGHGGLLFSGSLGYPPNADGAQWLAREVLPRVQRQRPGVKLMIVGRNAPSAVQALASDDVQIAGFVPELEPVLADAEVYVAGLHSGAGTKLKVVEALAAGRPLVATPVAAEGLDLIDGEHALIAEDADAFGAAVVRLLEDRELAAQLASAGRAHVAARFSWSAAVDALHALLLETLPPASD